MRDIKNLCSRQTDERRWGRRKGCRSTGMLSLSLSLSQEIWQQSKWKEWINLLSIVSVIEKRSEQNKLFIVITVCSTSSHGDFYCPQREEETLFLRCPQKNRCTHFWCSMNFPDDLPWRESSFFVWSQLTFEKRDPFLFEWKEDIQEDYRIQLRVIEDD
jgi:hypothetical protein